MRSLLSLSAVLAMSATLFADEAGLKKGTPTLKSISSIAFGPHGVLVLGDGVGGQVVAIKTDDAKSTGTGDVMIEKLGDKVGSALGTDAAGVTINDVKVNPLSGNIFLAATRKGANGGPVVLMLDRTGKMSEFSMKDVSYSQVTLPKGEGGTKKQGVSITSIAFVAGKVVVAGLSNEEFASTLWAIPYPFTEAARGTGIEIFHGAHGKFETNAPIQSFTPYKIGAADYIMAAYTCTPLVKIPVEDLKPGTKVKGSTIAELGNRNKPLDMIVYTKGGKDYVLMANSARGVMKIPAETFEKASTITSRGKGETFGVGYESIKELTGVLHLDRLDGERALLLVQAEDKSLSLKSVPLP
jgi:hypothetical protein